MSLQASAKWQCLIWDGTAHTEMVHITMTALRCNTTEWDVSRVFIAEQEVATFEAKRCGITLPLGLVIRTGGRACGQKEERWFKGAEQWKNQNAPSQTHSDEERTQKEHSKPTKNKDRRGKEIYYTDIKQSLLTEASAGGGLILWCFMNDNKEAMWHFLTKAIRRGANGEKIQEAYVANKAAGGLMWYLVIGGWSWVKWNFYHQWLRALWRKACSNEQLTNFRYLLIRFVVFGHQLGEIHEVNMDLRLDS